MIAAESGSIQATTASTATGTTTASTSCGTRRAKTVSEGVHARDRCRRDLRALGAVERRRLVPQPPRTTASRSSESTSVAAQPADRLESPGGGGSPGRGRDEQRERKRDLVERRPRRTREPRHGRAARPARGRAAPRPRRGATSAASMPRRHVREYQRGREARRRSSRRPATRRDRHGGARVRARPRKT